MQVIKTSLSDILSLREKYLQQMNCQIRYNACHERQWSDSYLFTIDGKAVGYGSIKGLDELADRDTIFEFYLLPQFQKFAHHFFRLLIQASNPTYAECQTNDEYWSSLFFESTYNIKASYILFGQGLPTQLKMENVLFRKRKKEDDVFGLKESDAGDYVLEDEGKIVATGGFLTHYNRPFADLYMEVDKAHFRKGYGSYIIQELVKASYNAGRVPAARCRVNHIASKATLIKGGLTVVAYLLQGSI